MSNGFIKFVRSQEARFLMVKHPNAFIVLSYIAWHARWIDGQPDGLIIGDALISAEDFSPGLSRQNFRTALDKLVDLKYIKIISNGKKFLEREKSTIKITIKSHLVNLCSSTVYDLNCYTGNQETNQQLTNSQPTGNHKQERRRLIKKEKKDHPSIPSKSNGLETRDEEPVMMIDDISSSTEIIPGIFLSTEELAACIKIKGTLENVKTAVEYIQNSKKRKHAISDWPNALLSWKIVKPSQDRYKENLALAEIAVKEFYDYHRGNGWRCKIHHDPKKDQSGILFEARNGYTASIFVAFSDSEYREKCRRIVLDNNMERKK